ncbi:MAG: hypothetical protein E5V46_16965, partial [Mesorhizobium sp.]
DAHRVIRWAGTAGEAVQNRLVRRLFQLNFEEGANLGDHAVLTAAAREAGMDASVVETLLPTDADVDQVRTEIATASRMGITGVPCYGEVAEPNHFTLPGIARTKEIGRFSVS